MNKPTAIQNDPGSYWLPFTANRQFRDTPRLFASAKDMHYTTVDGRQILDGIAGLWCVNAGHGRRPIIEAIKSAAEQLDFVSSFQMSHPGAFALTERLVRHTPPGLNHVFLTNSGSEAVDTALKIARSYHRARGQGGRTRFIGRARAYHGMGWGGLSVGGIARHRRDFGPLLPDVSHLPHAYDPQVSAFSKGQPVSGAHFADALTQLLTVHDPSTVAAVIVEPVAGSSGVFPPPVDYLQRLRSICDQHGVLLIFDEVITGFGRVGEPFAAQRFGVIPDIITCAKGLSNGAAPIGAAIANVAVYEAHMQGPPGAIELMHGYTYSGHPLACAAALATVKLFEDEELWTRAQAMEAPFEAALHGLKDAPHVCDVRNLGLVAAVDLEPAPGAPGVRGQQCNSLCFENDVLIRSTGDTLLISPPLIVSPDQIGRITDTIRRALAHVQ